MRLRAPAIVLAARPHAESGSVARFLTDEAGLVAGYVAGGRGRRLRPVLLPGNRVALDLSGRVSSQLPFASAELVESRAPYLGEPLIASAISWITALTASCLPEGTPYPALYQALDGLLAAMCAAPSARVWLPALITYERLLLRELGYGSSRLAIPDDMAGQAALFTRQGRAIAHYLLVDSQRDVRASRDMLDARLQRMVS